MLKINIVIKFMSLVLTTFFITETMGYAAQHKGINSNPSNQPKYLNSNLPAIKHQPQVISQQPITIHHSNHHQMHVAPNIQHQQALPLQQIKNQKVLPHQQIQHHQVQWKQSQPIKQTIQHKQAWKSNNLKQTQSWQGHQQHNDWHKHRHNDFVNNPFVDFFFILDSPYFVSPGPSYVTTYEANYVTNDVSPDTTYSNAVVNDNQLPNGNWVSTENGNVPNNAIGYQDQDGNIVYYCRASYNGQLYYGVLIPDDGCYTQDQSTSIRFSTYEALVSS